MLLYPAQPLQGLCVRRRRALPRAPWCTVMLRPSCPSRPWSQQCSTAPGSGCPCSPWCIAVPPVTPRCCPSCCSCCPGCWSQCTYGSMRLLLKGFLLKRKQLVKFDPTCLHEKSLESQRHLRRVHFDGGSGLIRHGPLIFQQSGGSDLAG